MSRVFGATRVAMMAVAAKGKGKASGAAAAGGGAAALSEKPRSTGIFKVVPISPAMRRFLGVQESSRTDAVKRIWQYIKENNLQKPRFSKCEQKWDYINRVKCARPLGSRPVIRSLRWDGGLAVGRELFQNLVINS